MRKIKFGICEWVLPIKGPLAIQIASELGFDGIQVDEWGGYRESFPMSNKRVQEGYLEASQKYGVELISFGANSFAKGGGLLNHMDSDHGKISLKGLEINIQTCHDMRIPIIMLPCFWKGFIKTEEHYKNVIEMLKVACQMAKDKNIIIALESALEADRIMEVLTKVNEENLKIYYDTENSNFFNNANAAEEINTLGKENIIQVHVKDGTKEILGCKILGQGETGFSESVKKIKEIGYDGYIVTENFYNVPPLGRIGQDPIEIIQKDLNILKENFT